METIVELLWARTLAAIVADMNGHDEEMTPQMIRLSIQAEHALVALVGPDEAERLATEAEDEIA